MIIKKGQAWIQQFSINEKVQGYFSELAKNAKTDSKLKVQTNGWASQKQKMDRSTYTVLNRMTFALNSLLYLVIAMLDRISDNRKDIVFWYVGIEAGGYIEMHDHIQSDWSAVFYPFDVKEDDGGILVFEDETRIVPRAGQCVYFPGHLKHRVTEYSGDSERLSIAINRVKP